MSDLTPLRELANAVRPGAPTQDVEGALARDLAARPIHRRVTEMLGTVMALSARTRRLVQEPVAIDLDVFSPEGGRAVRLTCGEVIS